MAQPAILLVDDEKTILDSLKQQLKLLFGRQFVYEAAENVDEAWEVIEELVDDGVRLVVVVSDWLMPDTRGDDFLADLRARHPEVARIMLTGQADAEALARVQRDSLAQRVLFKPWSADDLRSAIEVAAEDAAGS